MDLKYAISVMQAAELDGKEIQRRSLVKIMDCFGNFKPNLWVDCEPDWNWRDYDYRIKPQPLRLWVNQYPHGFSHHAHDSPEEARRCA